MRNLFGRDFFSLYEKASDPDLKNLFKLSRQADYYLVMFHESESIDNQYYNLKRAMNCLIPVKSQLQLFVFKKLSYTSASKKRQEFVERLNFWTNQLLFSQREFFRTRNPQATSMPASTLQQMLVELIELMNVFLSMVYTLSDKEDALAAWLPSFGEQLFYSTFFMESLTALRRSEIELKNSELLLKQAQNPQANSQTTGGESSEAAKPAQGARSLDEESVVGSEALVKPKPPERKLTAEYKAARQATKIEGYKARLQMNKIYGRQNARSTEDIAKIIAVSPATATRILQHMRASKIVGSEKQGKSKMWWLV